MTTDGRPTIQSRVRGSVLGLAAGDALGTTLEFKRPGDFAPVTDMIGGGPFGLKPGQWTDDTSMALCLAESLVECGGFVPLDQCKRYLRWWKEGHLSSTGQCFDIGNATRAALERFEWSGEPFSGGTTERSAGNGSLMRLAPVPLFFRHDPPLAIQLAGESSRTTHALPVCVDACRYFAGLILGALAGLDKATLLAPRFHPVAGQWAPGELHPEVEAVAGGTFRVREPPMIRGSGHVVRALEAALWAFARTKDFPSGCLLAANLGEDADTTAAIHGQLAGAYYGVEGIPDAWLARLAKRDVLDALADGLVAGPFA
ncbi:MAG: ADP-ribosylglycohydrolase family protein [Steroidobacteraceae bacterium]|jgi:ADP-ribosylglycohydrolase|nr:ADP-ribosylglycohydrolase family protein [Steroidobacteraceae bacterium]